ncbi:response regulator transcription factor [Nafulsella turpanensis]|uniref:response regulator transcription factor n=1 Tax=Nafulsella turpanensis TaxID=1265690 RepID=UPI0003778999|nr:response regulator transcription factor [Nafulsella turpanensis]
MQKAKLLVVEDDPNLGQILQEYLEVKGYETRLATDGEEGLKAYQQGQYDLCLLDVMLPLKDGFTLAEEIRKQDKQTPIIFLTAKSLKEDTLHGLRLGADDYITKPFSLEELLLRINAILKRAHPQPNRQPANAPLQVGKFTFLPQQQELRLGEKQISLTAKEAALLKMLIEHEGRTLDRSTALKSIWHDDSYFNARSMDVYITKLRKILKEDPELQIMSIRGEGFKLVKLR